MRVRSDGSVVSMRMRHVRTLVGIGLMLFSVAFVVLDKILQIRTAQTLCAASIVEVVHAWLFPVLLFGGGLLLFSRDAFLDLVGGTGRLLRRRNAPS